MSKLLVTVEQAAARLKLHPKTVLRYIRDGQIPATRIGKSYRIDRAKLDAFAGVASGQADEEDAPRATCIIDIPGVTAAEAERIASFLNAAAMARDDRGARLHLNTVFDPPAKSMKLVVIGSPSDAARLLELLNLQLGSRA